MCKRLGWDRWKSVLAIDRMSFCCIFCCSERGWWNWWWLEQKDERVSDFTGNHCLFWRLFAADHEVPRAPRSWNHSWLPLRIMVVPRTNSSRHLVPCYGITAYGIRASRRSHPTMGQPFDGADSSRFGAQEFASGAQKYQRTEIKNAMKKERRQPIRQLIGVNALKVT